MKRQLVSALTSPLMMPLFLPMIRDRITIFTLHRFADPENQIPGHSPVVLAQTLTRLRRHRFELLDLGTLVTQLDEGRTRFNRTVVFTVDDGYEDFARIGAPVFAQFDCPVTVFLTTGFLDGYCWMWWDEIEYALMQTGDTRLEVELGGKPEAWPLTTREERALAYRQLVALLKTFTDLGRRHAIDQIAAAVSITLPANPTPRYAPMTWDQVNACAARGATFGAHTVTHPILAQTGDPQAHWEIRESLRRVRTETAALVPVFCYPNGDLNSFGERELRILTELRVRAAVATEPNSLTAQMFRSFPYAIPRFPYPDSTPYALQMAAGLARFKQVALRR